MWTNIERGIDGVVGRMLSWLTHPPIHPSPFEEMEEGVEHLAETMSETVSEQVESASETLGTAARKVAEKAAETAREVADAVAETAREMADAVAETAEKISDAVAEEVEENAAEAGEKAEETAAAAPRAAASIEDDLELDDAVAAPDSGELDEPEKELLATLEPGSGGMSMKQLQQATGGTPYATRQRLNRLIRAGKVQRKGKGMRTRYHLAES